MIELAGERVRLRTIGFADVDALVEVADADPASFGGGGEERRQRLRKQVERNPTLEDGGFLALVVEVEDRVIGEVQARAPNNAFPPGVCEIGISLLPAARGHGYGREAVALFTEHLLGTGVARIQASTAVANRAMGLLLERVGYCFEGVLREFAPTEGGGRDDYVMYAATAGTWRRAG